MDEGKKGIFGGGKPASDVSKPTEAVSPDATPVATATKTPADPEKIKAQKKEAADRLKTRKTEALNKLIDLAKRIGTDEEKAAAAYLEPGRHIAGGGQTGPKTPKVKKDFFAELFADTKEIHEDDLFLKHKLGRPDMNKLIREAINAEPEKRRWVLFNPGTGIYTLVSTGPDAPEGWLGAMPKAPKVL